MPIHAPGETKGDTSKPFRGMLPPKGRHWRCSVEELEKLDAAGLIEWSRNGNPRKINYADEHLTKKVQDIWEFKDPTSPIYPTEKSLKNDEVYSRGFIKQKLNSNGLLLWFRHNTAGRRFVWKKLDWNRPIRHCHQHSKATF